MGFLLSSLSNGWRKALQDNVSDDLTDFMRVCSPVSDPVNPAAGFWFSQPVQIPVLTDIYP